MWAVYWKVCSKHVAIWIRAGGAPRDLGAGGRGGGEEMGGGGGRRVLGGEASMGGGGGERKVSGATCDGEFRSGVLLNFFHGGYYTSRRAGRVGKN